VNTLGKFALILTLSALTQACNAPKAKLHKDVGSPVETTFSLAYVCPDKQELYKDTDGNLMQWNTSYFVHLDKGLTPEVYCQGHQKG
jgi:hypothetical protein